MITRKYFFSCVFYATNGAGVCYAYNNRPVLISLFADPVRVLEEMRKDAIEGATQNCTQDFHPEPVILAFNRI